MLSKILFLDIETVPEFHKYEELSESFKLIWNKKASRITPEEEPKNTYETRAGIYAEYGKVVAISLGYFIEGEELTFRTKGLHNTNEIELLSEFIDLLQNKFPSGTKLCAHNGKEFDFPYLCRRMLINGLNIPTSLQVMGKKPWEVPHLDTLELWKFGDYKHYTSLETLTTIFNIPSSKDDIDGSQVAKVYYTDNDLPRISKYCTNDVIATARVYLKLMNIGELKSENIYSA